ncbi:glycosyltransferase [Glaciihabitans sp. dw_435]|uniref:glycosyltransferase n=1 Tax=Glaciihabitans sp. dw_435 TaxID=2720081 RepID=UPI001BD662EF|nr:glycosyltransferase [Glaciihabitans sp. dw_435]
MTWRHQQFTDASLKRHVLVVASTFPSSPTDPVPAFVKELVVATRLADPATRISVLAPHDPRSDTQDFTRHEYYDEYRFRYMWPRRWQVLAGQGGIGPSLRRNRFLYLVVPFFLFFEFFAVLRLNRMLRPDVINAHWIIPQGVVCALANLFARRKLVLTVHGGDVFTFNHPFAIWLKRWAMRRSARIVVNSTVTRDKARSIYPDGDYEVIPMGVDLAEFEGRQTTGDAPLRVLFVGRLSEEKGVIDLLDALAILQERGIPFQARIAGTGPQAAELVAMGDATGLGDSAQFLGWVAHDQLADHYHWADVFVGPSIASSTGWIEALGVVFIEASASGLPIVTTDTGGMRDVVLDRETGFIVEEKSPEQIADRLAQLSEDRQLGLRLGAAGVRRVTTNFSWPSIASRYAELFRA